MLNKSSNQILQETLWKSVGPSFSGSKYDRAYTYQCISVWLSEMRLTSLHETWPFVTDHGVSPTGISQETQYQQSRN